MMRIIIVLLVSSCFQLNLFAQNVWEKTNFPANKIVVALDNIPRYSGDSSVLFAITDDGMLITSYNNGDKWIPEIISFLPEANSVVSNQHGFVFFGTKSGGIFKSNNYGDNFDTFYSNEEDEIVKVLLIYDEMNDTGIVSYILAYSSLSGLMLSPIDNEDFIEINNGIEGKVITCAYKDNYSIYLGTENNGVYYKQLDATHWLPVNGFSDNHGITSIHSSLGFQIFCTSNTKGVYIINRNHDTLYAKDANNGLTTFNVDAVVGCDDVVIEMLNDYPPGVPVYSVLTGTDKGVFYQSDSHKDNFKWISMNSGLTDSNITSLTMKLFKTAYAGVASGGLYRTTMNYVYNTDVISIDINDKFIIDPNPSQDKIIIKASIEKPGNIEISLYNSLGRIVKTMEDSYFQGGEFNESYEISDFPNGIYYIKIVSEAQIYTKKIIIIH